MIQSNLKILLLVGVFLGIICGCWFYCNQQKKIEYFDTWLEKLEVYTKTELIRYRVFDDADWFDKEYEISATHKIDLSAIKMVKIEYSKSQKRLVITIQVFDKKVVKNLQYSELPKEVSRKMCDDLSYLIMDNLMVFRNGEKDEIQKEFIDNLEFIFSSGEMGDQHPEGGIAYRKNKSGEVVFNSVFVLRDK